MSEKVTDIIILFVFLGMCIGFCLELLKRYKMVDQMLHNRVLPDPDYFIASIDRAEASSDPVVWSKAVRCTLIELGFNEHWVNEVFRERIDSFYE